MKRAFLWILLPVLAGFAFPQEATEESINTNLINVVAVGYDIDRNPKAQKMLQEMAEAARAAGAVGEVIMAGQDAAELDLAMQQAVSIAVQSPSLPAPPPAAPSGVGGGGGGVVAAAPRIGWPVILIIALAAASLVLLITLVVLRSRATGVSGSVSAGLEILGGDGERRVVRLQGARTTIGRSEGNTLVFNDPEVSSRHVEIIASREGFVIRDLGSANGTFLHSERISESPLFVGDEVTIGRTRIKLMP